MILPKRSDPCWNVYVDVGFGPWTLVASCLTPEAKDAVCRLYEPEEACWAEVTKP